MFRNLNLFRNNTFSPSLSTIKVSELLLGAGHDWMSGKRYVPGSSCIMSAAITSFLSFMTGDIALMCTWPQKGHIKKSPSRDFFISMAFMTRPFVYGSSLTRVGSNVIMTLPRVSEMMMSLYSSCFNMNASLFSIDLFRRSSEGFFKNLSSASMKSGLDEYVSESEINCRRQELISLIFSLAMTSSFFICEVLIFSASWP